MKYFQMKRKYLLSLALAASLSASAQTKLYPNEFPLSEVTLLESPFQHARDLNVKTLLAYDVDRLLALI